MRKIRVLHVIPGTPEGSSMIFAKQTVAHLQKFAVHNEVFFLGSRTSPVILWTERRRFSQTLQDFQPQLIHAHFGTMTAFFCAVTTRLPLVISFRGSDLNPAPHKSRLRWLIGYLFSQFSALRASHIHCVSQQLRERLWWRRHRASVIPSPINLELFQPLSRDLARSKLGWVPDELVVLFNAGSDNQSGLKGLNLVEAAVEHARAKIGPIHLEILRQNVPHEQMPLLMNASDCLAFASYFEGSPNVIKEALACNLPIVSVDVGDVVERIEKVDW